MKLFFIFGLMFLAMLSRLVPHPPNFTAMTAVALFAGVYLKDNKLALFIPFAALVLSDLVIGFYPGAWSVYLSFAAVFLFSYWFTSQNVPIKVHINNDQNHDKNLQDKKTNHFDFKKVAISGALGSFIFFVLSNFFVWLNSQMYTMDVTGFIECYVAAIPFYRNQIMGDMFYSTLLFGTFELVQKAYPKFAN